MRAAILFALILSACGRNQELNEFSGYVVAFEAEATARGIAFDTSELNIRMGATDDPKAIAQCTDGIITVSIVAWPQTKEEDREAVMLHELGHCVLGRGHSDALMERDGKEYRASLMHPSAPTGAQFNKFREHYLNELFGVEL